MKAIFNNGIINDKDLTIGADDRAFQYGDGVFETIIIRNNPSKLLKYHYNRLVEGARTLNFQLPAYFNIQFLESSILMLIQENGIKGSTRIKVQAWRGKGGYYRPESNTSNLVITVNVHRDEAGTLKNVGISKSVNNQYTIYSEFKTLNALKYIIASIEKEESHFDDLIILDQTGNVSELLYSNIFWIKKNIFYTPSLETGCIRGVMRSYLIERLKEKSIPLMEVKVTPEQLYKADYAFATNASGIRSIIGIVDVQYKVCQDFDKIIDPELNIS